MPDYDEAITFFCNAGFDLREDTDLGQGKRWVRVAPRSGEMSILLAKASDAPQRAAIGHQGGGRVWLFLESADFDADRQRLETAGAIFEEAAREEPYGRVAVWRDPWGNHWDLIQPRTGQ